MLGGLAENWFFVPPTRQLTVHQLDDVVALLGGLVVAVAVATVVDRSARRATAAARSQAETAMLASLARSVLAGDRGLPSLLEQIREAFGLRSVTMIERTGDGETEPSAPAAGPDPRTTRPRPSRSPTPWRCGCAAGPCPPSERRVLVAFAEQAAVALQQGRLAAQAAEADRLAAGNSMRTALLAAVSHDLRTPLAGIKAAVVGAALGRPRPRLTPTGPSSSATIDESADRLTGLVDNLLDMSRLQAGAVSPALSPDRRAGRRAPGRQRAGRSPTARASSWTGRTTCRPSLADPGLLERVVANLVSNAVRHAPTGPVDRDRRRRSATGSSCASSTADPACPRPTGTGSSPRSSGSATPRPARASGSGWRSPAGLTEAMGGTVTAEDTPGGGLTMVVLPAGRRPRPRPAADPRAGAVSRVLVVDDDPQLARALRITLRAAGYDVVTAADGRAALHEAAAHHPDLVVLDLGLPDLDGTEVLAGLRPWYTGPVLVLSARGRQPRQGRRARRRRRRLRHQAVRHGRAAGPAACAAAAGHRGAGRARWCAPSHFTVDLAATAGDRGRRRRPADPDRVGAAVGTRPRTRPAGRAAAAAAGGVGPGLREGDPLPAGLHGPAAPQAGARPGPARATCSPSPAWATASPRDGVRSADVHVRAAGRGRVRPRGAPRGSPGRPRPDPKSRKRRKLASGLPSVHSK